ncbi:MAG: SoxR reducing system RseC family protein [Candidatus Cloacimonetes bacterium]|nr:SoxR reducing system RseC family protein [Candidatus Cloacimonadota bacterium]
MEIIEDIAIVKEVRNKQVLVAIPRSESCESCAAHGLCHKGEEPATHWITSDLKLEKGDYVKLFISPALRITSGIIIFLLPVFIMLIFYLIPRFLLSATENISILSSILSLGVSGLVIYILDKSWGKRIRFEIVEKLSEED